MTSNSKGIPAQKQSLPEWRRKSLAAAYEEEEKRAERFGDLDKDSKDVCIRVVEAKSKPVEFFELIKENKDEKTGVVTKEYKKHPNEWYFPYQVAYYLHHGWVPKKSQGIEISHRCGDNRCINIFHLIAELHSTNVGRQACHAAIKKWIHAQKHLAAGKYTMRDVLDVNGKKCSCPHGTESDTECFIQIGAERSRKKKKSVKSYDTSNLRRSERGQKRKRSKSPDRKSKKIKTNKC